MTLAAAVPAVRRVATYERVSSEDQRERETIRTQTDEIARHLERQPGVELVSRYVDDGVSGTIPLAERPDGRRLLADAAAGRFEEIWVYKVDRLGRDAVDLLIVRRRLDALGIALVSVVEGQPDLLGYDVQAVVADHYRREFARRSADGMNRAAREGRYTGGIVPFGYRVEGHKATARLVPDDAVVWADRSAADLVRDMYERLALRAQSCRLIARDFNAAGIPTHYVRDGRGVRGRRTQGLWRPGRIRNLVVNPLYRGELRYGSRTTKREREVIAAPIAALVSPHPMARCPRCPRPQPPVGQEQRSRLPAARGDQPQHHQDRRGPADVGEDERLRVGLDLEVHQGVAWPALRHRIDDVELLDRVRAS